MNNDELKKKIADIIYHTGCTGACCECDYSKHSDADTYCKAMLKASALIEAGIGDVKEAERKSFVFKNELAFTIHRARAAELVAEAAAETGIEKMAEMKHRAEVAERALDLCETAYILALNNREHEGISQQAILSDLGVHGFFMQQAEKELSEEGTAG